MLSGCVCPSGVIKLLEVGLKAFRVWAMSALGGFVMLGAGGCSPRILEASEVLVLLTPYFLFHHISSKLKRRGAGLFERERERERESM